VAVIGGAGIIILPILLSIFRPGTKLTRHVIAASQMLASALLIHLTGGRIETHFHVFGSLAFLAFYLDWTALITATVVVAADHFLRGIFWPESVYGVANPEWWRFLEHAGWVAFEDVFLIWACVMGRREIAESAARQAQVEHLSELEQLKSAALEMAMSEIRVASA
jgi:signal transduction histidine kinase